MHYFEIPKKLIKPGRKLLWLALSSFSLFIIYIIFKSYGVTLLDVSPANEAAFLLLITACFVIACMQTEQNGSFIVKTDNKKIGEDHV
jgi:hypothetical protein